MATKSKTKAADIPEEVIPPAEVAPESPEPVAEEVVKTVSQSVDARYGLNLRFEPAGEKIASVKRGTSLKTLAPEGEWTPVVLYVKSEYLED